MDSQNAVQNPQNDFFSRLTSNPDYSRAMVHHSARVTGGGPNESATRATKQGLQLVNWVCTIWPDKYASVELCREALSVIAAECDYSVFGLEVAPDTKQFHIHGVCVFKERKRLTELKKLFGVYLHWEPMMGTVDQAVAYATKEDEHPIVTGEKPVSPGEREKSRFMAAREQAMTGDPDAVEDAQIYIQHFSNISRIAHRALAMRETKDLVDLPECYWLYGVPGAGKSFFARKKFPALYVKEPNQWWNNYLPSVHTCVLIEDLDPTHDYMAHHVKTWTDRYAFRGNVKNEDPILIRPKAFIITSNYSVEQIFGKTVDRQVDCQAIRRRMKVLYFSEPYVEGKEQAPNEEQYVPPPPGTAVTFNAPPSVPVFMALAPVPFDLTKGTPLSAPVAVKSSIDAFQTPPARIKRMRLRRDVPATQPLDEADEFETDSDAEDVSTTAADGSRARPFVISNSE